MVISEGLLKEVARFALQPQEGPWDELLESLLARHSGTEAILFYGSCLRQRDWRHSLVDLYLLVDSYRRAYENPILALANELLPPNVFYLERKTEEGTIRSKYAVVKLEQFWKATSPRSFHSYFWGRFCQPTILLYARDGKTCRKVLKALAQSVFTFLLRVFPLAPPKGALKDLWLTGLSWSYRAELRPESPERLSLLWSFAEEYFHRVSREAFPLLPYRVWLKGDRYLAEIPMQIRKKTRRLWLLRVAWGKVLSVLRLLKASFTFQGGVDYALWKIERHTGRRFHVPEPLRSRPWLALVFLGWRVIKEGGVR